MASGQVGRAAAGHGAWSPAPRPRQRVSTTMALLFRQHFGKQRRRERWPCGESWRRLEGSPQAAAGTRLRPPPWSDGASAPGWHRAGEAAAGGQPRSIFRSGDRGRDGEEVVRGAGQRPAPRPGRAGALEGGRCARPAVASPDLEGGRERALPYLEGGREKGRGNGRDDDGSVDILLVLVRKQQTHRSYEEIRTSNPASNSGN